MVNTTVIALKERIDPIEYENAPLQRIAEREIYGLHHSQTISDSDARAISQDRETIHIQNIFLFRLPFLQFFIQ